MTAFGLLEQMHKNHQLHWTETECAELIREWYKARPKAFAFVEGKKAEARKYGYVTDMWGVGSTWPL